MHPSIVIAMLSSVMISAPGTAQSSRAEDTAVLDLVQSFSSARARFDAKTLDTLLTPDYLEVSPRGEVDRRSDVLGFYAPDNAAPVPPMTLGTQDVRRYSDTAIVIGSIEYEVPGPDGVTVKRTVRVTYVEHRIGGRWLMASAQFTGVQPPKSQPAAIH